MEYSALLTSHEVERVDDTSKKILENVGILARNGHARDIYAEHGCTVDSQTGIVRISRRLVEEYQKAFVPTFSFTAQDPAFDRTIPDDSPVIVTASSAPNIVDPDTGEARRATSTDIANIAHLINRLPGYDVFSISTLAEDAPKDQFSISRFIRPLKTVKNRFAEIRRTWKNSTGCSNWAPLLREVKKPIGNDPLSSIIVAR